MCGVFDNPLSQTKWVLFEQTCYDQFPYSLSNSSNFVKKKNEHTNFTTSLFLNFSAPSPFLLYSAMFVVCMV